MKNDITYEQRVFTNRIVDIDSMSVGNFTSKNIKKIKQKDKVDGRFFHTSDTDEWFFCWGGELQKLNLKGVSLSDVVGITGKIEESVKNANKTSDDAKVAADAAVKNVESLSARIDDIESPSLDGYATEDFVNEKVANLVGSAPETLDTIGELSEALKNNKDLVDVLTKSIGTKQDKIDDLDAIRYNASNAAADATTKANAAISASKEYADSLASNYDAAGSAEEALENAKDYVDSKGYLTEHQDISGKQDVISDLETIRTGAAAGATALDEAKEYADGLASNYDDAGSAAKSLEDAKAYVDGKGYATIVQLDVKVDKDELKDYALKKDIKEPITYIAGSNIDIIDNKISTKGYSTNDGGNSISVGVNNTIIVDDGGNNGVNGMCCGSNNTLRKPECNLLGVGLNSDYTQCVHVGRYNASLDWTKDDNDDDSIIFVIGSGYDDSRRQNLLLAQRKKIAIRSGEFGQDWIGDFAEYFEWHDGNIDNEDRIGYMVQVNENKIEKANDLEKCIGVITNTNAVTIASCSFEWHNKYLKDEWSRVILDENNQPILNPEFNEKQVYLPREKRKEWAPVGLLGQLLTRQDGTLKVGGFAGCKDGIATDAESGYRVLKIINENIALLLVK